MRDIRLIGNRGVSVIQVSKENGEILTVAVVLS